jgi:hypothetical protein
MQKPWRNDTHLRIARLVVATDPVSWALSTMVPLSMIEKAQPVRHVFREGTANAPPEH